MWTHRYSSPVTGWISLLASVALLGCGDDGSGRESGTGATAVTTAPGLTVTAGATTSAGSDSEATPTTGGTTGAGLDGSGVTTDAEDSAASQSSAEDEGGLKFDNAVPDAGAKECSGGVGDVEYDFSYIWIANTAVGTVAKIATKTGVIEGRYQTSVGKNSPSRTTVNQFGDVLVGNRGEVGSVLKIASRPERCVDKNGNGVIDTSSGPDDVRPWGEDECVLWTTPIPSGDYDRGPRALAWEGGDIDPVTCELTVPDPRVWVGWDGATTYEVVRLNGTTGMVEDAIHIPDAGGRPYGGAVNKEGDFWMAVRGGPLTFIDGETLEVKTYKPPSSTYGMGVDKNGDPWVVIYSAGPGKDQIFRFDVASETFVNTGGIGGYYRGMQVDREGRVWVAGNTPCRLILVDGINGALVNDTIPVPGCKVPVGISIDVDGFVWMVDQGASMAFKIDPVTYAVALTVPGLSSPYTYSDMTGNGLNLVLNPPG